MGSAAGKKSEPGAKAFLVTIETPDGRRRSFPVRSDQHILEAALEAGVDLPYSCLQGWCLTCAARIIEGTVDQGDSRRFFEDDRKAGFALICTGRPKSDLVLCSHARDAMRAARDARGLPFPRGDWGTK